MELRSKISCATKRPEQSLVLEAIPAVWPSGFFQAWQEKPEGWEEGRGQRKEGEGPSPAHVHSSLNRFQRLRCVSGMKAALGPLPASSSAASKLRASHLSGWRHPCYAENGNKIKKKNKKKAAKPTTTKNTAPAPPLPPVSTTQQQPRKARSFISPEDVTIETEIRPTPRILPPGKAIKCFLSIAVGKVTADKPSEEKWSGDAGTRELFK